MQKRVKLKENWLEFCDLLNKIEIRNNQVYQDFYKDTLKDLDNFNKECGDIKVQFSNNAPFTVGTLTNEKAFSILNDYADNLSQLRKKETSSKFGYDLFNINYNSSPDL